MRKEHITNIKKAVCIMANQLHKMGMSLSSAFKKAWRRVKKSMTFRVVGTTFENRQERLRFLQQFDISDLYIGLDREIDNRYDSNAIAITIYIKSIHKKTVIGYVPKGLASELAQVLDSNVKVYSYLNQIIGGYDNKENLGALITVTI